MITCNVISPHFFWFKKLRTNMLFVWIISIFVNIGMWFERFVIIVTSLHRDYLPSSWGYFTRPGWTSSPSSAASLFMTLFPPVYPVPAGHRHQRGQGRDPQADPHHPLGGAKDHH